MNTSEFVAPHAFIAFVEARGYRATPITNTIAAAEGADIQIVAYELRGPRGNKTIVAKNSDGLLPLFDAKLWCDGVDYATRKIARATTTRTDDNAAYRRDMIDAGRGHLLR